MSRLAGVLPIAIGAWVSVLCLSQAAPEARGGPATTPSREQSLTQLDFRQVVRQAKDKVFPAVVYIRCLRETHESGKKLTQEVSGSGVLISADGELLTNWHVVDKATEVRCLLTDGRAFKAKVLGTDKDTDLALLKLGLETSDGAMPFAALGDSSVLKEGDFVMAMGAPWGMSRSVSMGIVSCTRRYLPDNSEYSLWLQTDAAISPGNSGGPLVNTQGQVVGINTRGVMQGGDMGFAIPSATVKVLIPQLREFGRMNWSWTGLQLQPLKDFQRNVYFEGSEGVMIADTDPESPTRRAGIHARDRLLAVNGQAVTGLTAEDLPEIRIRLGLLPKEKPATLLLLRDGKRVEVCVTPREKGKVEGEELDCPRWDMTVKTINQFDNEELYWHRKKGVYVYGVKYPGNAATAGLAAQDIILQIDGQEIATLDQVREIHAKSIKAVNEQARVLVVVLRNGLMRQIVLDFSRDYEKE